MNKVSKIGLENRVLTPELFKSNFNTMRERVKTYLSVKYRYAVNGNKVTANSIEDYLQNGLERLIGSFDFENCLFNNETITIYGFQKLWFYLSQQSVYADNVRSSTTKKGVQTKIVVSNIVTQLDGKECVANNVENRLLEMDSINTKERPTMNVRKIVRKAIECAETKSDKKFYERLLAHLLIQSTIRKANKVDKAISLKEIMDCFTNQFENVGAYIMFRTRMETDIRIKKLRKVA
jgi:ribosomal protein L17